MQPRGSPSESMTSMPSRCSIAASKAVSTSCRRRSRRDSSQCCLDAHRPWQQLLFGDQRSTEAHHIASICTSSARCSRAAASTPTRLEQHRFIHGNQQVLSAGGKQRQSTRNWRTTCFDKCGPRSAYASSTDQSKRFRPAPTRYLCAARAIVRRQPLTMRGDPVRSSRRRLAVLSGVCRPGARRGWQPTANAMRA
jgi:hypothetical protein